MREGASACVVGVAAGLVIFALADNQPVQHRRAAGPQRFSHGRSIDTAAVRQALESGEYTDVARWAVDQYMARGDSFVAEVREAARANEATAIAMPEFDKAALRTALGLSR